MYVYDYVHLRTLLFDRAYNEFLCDSITKKDIINVLISFSFIIWTWLGDICISPQRAIPVSYTHLDVYKRQVHKSCAYRICPRRFRGQTRRCGPLKRCKSYRLCTKRTTLEVRWDLYNKIWVRTFQHTFFFT